MLRILPLHCLDVSFGESGILLHNLSRIESGFQVPTNSRNRNASAGNHWRVVRHISVLLYAADLGWLALSKFLSFAFDLFNNAIKS